MDALFRLHDLSSRSLFLVAGAALVASTGLYVAEVALRYAFNAPTTWSGEFVEYGLLVIIFLSLPEVTRAKAHITMDLVSQALSHRGRKALHGANMLVSACVCFASSYFAGVEALRQFNRNVLTNAANPIPRWWLTTLICVGLASAGLHLLRNAFGGGR